MSGFSTRWLDLREPADRLARDPALLEQAATYLQSRQTATLVDLGCGTGSTFRTLAPRLQSAQTWRLVDHDPALIGEAISRIGSQAQAEAHPLDLRLLDTLPLQDADLVTASALFDLAGADWLAAFVAQLQRANVGLYAALNYNGHTRWSEPLPDDTAVLAAFNHHQRSDKGLGPALGPEAGSTLARLLQAQGYRVVVAQSPWQLQGASDFQRELLHGIANAAIESSKGISASGARDWLEQRLARMDSSQCVVGHTDLLALPG